MWQQIWHLHDVLPIEDDWLDVCVTFESKVNEADDWNNSVNGNHCLELSQSWNGEETNNNKRSSDAKKKCRAKHEPCKTLDQQTLSEDHTLKTTKLAP